MTRRYKCKLEPSWKIFQKTPSTQQPQLVCTWSAPAPHPSPQSPFPRTHHTLTATANAAGELFVFGGLVDDRGYSGNSDLYLVSTRDSSTTLLQTSGKAPTSRYEHCATLIGTTLLISGGGNSGSVLHDDSLYLLNLETREWSHVVVNGPGPGGRKNHTANVVGSKLFIFGGWGGQRILDDTWTLDLNDLTSQRVWESYKPTPGNEKPLPRWGHVSVATGDHIIIFGGYSQQGYCNDTWSFDISTRKWTELQCTGSIPSPRRNHAAVLVDGVMYVFGGYRGGDNYLDDLIALQLSTQRWFHLHNVGQRPRGKWMHAMASDGTHVFVHGGSSQRGALDELHVFDTKDIKYPEPERNAVNPDEKTTQLPRAGNSFTGPSTQVQPQHPTLEQQLSVLVSVQAERDEELADIQAKLDELLLSRDQQIGQYERKLETVCSRLADAEKGLTLLDELVVSHDQQVGQHEKELTDMRAKLEAKESELEAVRSRLTDAEKALTKSKAEADTLRAQNITDSRNRDEDQVTRELTERVQAIEDEMARGSKWNEKSIVDMVCRNEE